MEDDLTPVPAGRFRLYKGPTRVPTFKGVPTVPLVFVAASIFICMMQISMWCALAVVPAWVIMAAITKTDDKAFRQWGLWVRLVLWEVVCNIESYRLWRAVSISPISYVAPGSRPANGPVLIAGSIALLAWLISSWWLFAVVPIVWIVGTTLQNRKTT